MRKMGSTLLGAVLGTVVVLGLGSTAHALSTTIGGRDLRKLLWLGIYLECGWIQEPQDLWNVTYSVNTSGSTGAGTGLDAIAFKIAEEASYTSESL